MENKYFGLTPAALKTSGVYGLIVGGRKIYIGSSQYLYSRFRNHRSGLDLNRHFNPVLQSYWNHRGESSILAIILDSDTSVQELLFLEKKWIETFDFFEDWHVINFTKDPIEQVGRSSLLNEHQVGQIKQLLAEEILTHLEIADLYNVSRPAVSCIARLETWVYVRPELNKYLKVRRKLSPGKRLLKSAILGIAEQLNKNKLSIGEIANMFNVSPARVRDISCGRRYSYLVSPIKRVKLHTIGERHPQAKLSESAVLDIRALLKTPMKQKQIARLYDIAPATVCNIKTRKIWRHI